MIHWGIIMVDQVLIQIVEAIKKNLRDNDYLGRIGGDESNSIL